MIVVSKFGPEAELDFSGKEQKQYEKFRFFPPSRASRGK
jgi:hypothetical protein